MMKDLTLNEVCQKYGVSREEVRTFISKGLFSFGDREYHDLVFPLQDITKLDLLLQLKNEGLSYDKAISILKNKTIYPQSETHKIAKNHLFEDSFYRELFFESPSYLTITDDKGNIIEMNKVVREKLGYGDEMIGKSLLEFHPEDLRLEATENLYRIINGDLEYCPLDILTKDGRRMKVESRIVIVENEGQKLMLGISSEKSISQEMDKMLEKRENLFRTLFQISMSASIIISQETGKILTVNRAWEVNTGYQSEDILGKTIAELNIISEIDKLTTIEEEIADKGFINDQELIFNAKTGEKRVINISASLIDYYEPSILISGVDITDYKESQQRLETTVAEKIVEIKELYELNEAIIDAIPDFVVLLDQQGQIHKVYDSPNNEISLINKEDQGSNINNIFTESASFIIKLAVSETYLKGYSFNNVFRQIIQGQENWYSISLSKINNVKDLVVGVISDITVTVRHTLELENSESRYRSIFNSKASAMLLIDVNEGEVFDANKAAEELFGINSNLLKRMTFSELIPKGNVILRNITNGNDVTKDGEQFKTEILTSKKETKHIELYIGSIYFNKQRRLIAIIHDITAEFMAESLLTQQKVRLQTVIDGSAAGLWDWNVQTGELTVEGNFFGMLGFKREDLEPISIETWRLLCHPEDLKKSDKLIQDMLDGKTDNYECEIRMKHKSGDWIWIFDKGKIIENDDQGNPIRLAGTHIEFTERKKAQLNLECRFAIEELLNKMSKDFIESDVFATSEVIDRSLKLIGEFSKSDRCYFFIFQNDPELMSNTNEWCSKGIEPQIEILQDLPVSIFPWWMKKLKNFETIYVPDVAKMEPEASEEQKILQEQDIKSVLVIPVYSEKKLLGFLGFDAVKDYAKWLDSDIFLLENVGVMIANNLSREELLVNLIDAKKIAQESNRIKSEFIANINHEIRTPLHTLFNFFELMKISDLPVEIKKIIPSIAQSTNNLADMLQSILTINNIDSGKIKINEERCNFSTIVNNIIYVYKADLSEKIIDIVVDLKEEKTWDIITDFNLLKNILNAIISNAIKYSEKGTIKISAEIEESDRTFLSITISDQGSGMDEFEIKNIFVTFYQSEDFITKKNSGFGLGMPIVKKFIDLLGGNIEIKSEKNVGTDINLKLPIKLSSEQAQLKEISREGISVLLVEDNSILVKMMKKVFEKNTFHISIAINGQIAVDLSKKKKVDVILMDIQMPVMDGIAAARIIKTDPTNPNYKTPIIAVSAHLEYDELEYSHEFDDLVQKPVNFKCLFQKIYSLIDKSK